MLPAISLKTVRDRWKGMTIAVVSMGLMLLFGMAVYRDIDLSLYSEMPEALRSLMNIPDEADVGGLAYGAIYGAYGALTLAALALAMGSSSIAGEERDGTIGLLLGNPKSRTHVLVSKASSMVVVTGLGAAVLWGAGLVVPAMLDVSIAGMHIGAMIFHMYLLALFHGFLAMAIGAWTGRSGVAAGATTAVMVISLFAVGLFPLIEGWEEVPRAFPWYYYSGNEPVSNGVHWGHAAVLLAGCAVLAVAAVVGLNRRDLRAQTDGAGLVERLRSHPLTRKVADRLAGSTRVSRIWIKTLSEHQGLLIITGASMFLVMGVLMGPLYALMDETVLDLAEQLPEVMIALVGGGDMTTPEGFYQVETYGLMAPIATILVAVVIGARGLAGEEARRTMGLLLANPISRTRVLMEKTVAMVALSLAVGFATFAGTVAGSVIGGLGMNVAHIAATCLLASLVGLVFGALALVISSATGKARLAIYATIGVALVLYVIDGLSEVEEGLLGYARWSPFHYYLTSDPLNTGMHWGHAGLLAGLTALMVAGSVLLFRRRDLRQTG